MQKPKKWLLYSSKQDHFDLPQERGIAILQFQTSVISDLNNCASFIVSCSLKTVEVFLFWGVSKMFVKLLHSMLVGRGKNRPECMVCLQGQTGGVCEKQQPRGRPRRALLSTGAHSHFTVREIPDAQRFYRVLTPSGGGARIRIRACRPSKLVETLAKVTLSHSQNDMVLGEMVSYSQFIQGW